MAAWRSSCPRLTVWEDALDAGFVMRKDGDAGSMVTLIHGGWRFLERRAFGSSARQSGSALRAAG